MTVASYVFGIVAALLVLVVVIEMLRRRRLRERHALWWLIAGVLALIAGVFPQVLGWFSNLIGITVPTNLVFFVSIAILFLVSLQQSAELTQMESKVRILAERSAIQDRRIEAIEARKADECAPEHEDQRDPGSQPASGADADGL
jgi:hypothetical protein